MNELTIIYEDDVLLVIDKPAGLMVEPDRNNHPNLLTEVKKYIRSKTGESLPYVQHLHRIDRPVSGIVLFTKKREYLHVLSDQFAERSVKKKYLALTEKTPDAKSGTLEHWHRKEKKKGNIVPEGTPYSEKVILHYKIQAQDPFYLWDIELITGKFHQIRAQLSAIGCPIIGDDTYGSTRSFAPEAIALHATELTIKHPATGKDLTFRSDSLNILSFCNKF